MSKVKDSETQGKTAQVECPECKVTTKHSIVRAIEWSEFYDGPDISIRVTYQIVRCNGCDAVSFRSVHSDSETLEVDERGNTVRAETEHLYPERVNRSLTDELYLRDDVYEVPEIVQTIYRETLKAVQHGMPTLAGVGIRAILEATCRELKATHGTLEKRIEKLVELSLLTRAGAEILHGIRLLGNDAAHEIKAPTKKQIAAALKVIDHLLLGVYVLPKEASILPRPKPKAEKKTVAKGAGTKVLGGTP